MPTSGHGEATAFLATEFGEAQPMLSPEGCWLAYTSNGSGRWDIYVTQTEEALAPTTVLMNWASELEER